MSSLDHIYREGDKTQEELIEWIGAAEKVLRAANEEETDSTIGMKLICLVLMLGLSSNDREHAVKHISRAGHSTYEDFLMEPELCRRGIAASIEKYVSAEMWLDFASNGLTVLDAVHCFPLLARYNPERGHESTPEEICELAAGLLEIREEDRLLDLCAGVNTFIDGLPELDTCESRAYETDEFSWLLSVCSSYFLHRRETCENSDIFDLIADPVHADRIFMNYNICDRNGYSCVSDAEWQRRGKALMKKLGFTDVSYCSPDWCHVLLAASLLSADGRAAVIVPYGMLCNEADRRMREQFIAAGLMETVINLPEKLFGETPVRTSLLVLSHGNSDIRIRDISTSFTKRWKLNILSDEAVDEILRNSKSLRKVSSSEVMAHGSVLSEELYAHSVTSSDKPYLEYIVRSVSRGVELSKTELASLMKPSLEEDGTSKEIVRYLSPIAIENGEYSVRDLPRLYGIPDRLRKYSLSAGDVILARSVYPFKAAMADVPKNTTVIVSSNLYMIRVDTEQVLPQYLALYFRSDIGQKLLDGIASGTSTRNIPVASLNRLRIDLPPISEQMKIVTEWEVLQMRKTELQYQLEAISSEQDDLLGRYLGK